MGCCFTQKEIVEIIKKPLPVDFVFKPFIAKHDNFFKIAEEDMNYFQYLQLHDFLVLLQIFSTDENEVDSDIKAYNKIITKQSFTVFIDLKIIKHFLIFPDSSKSNSFSEDFKLLYENFYEILFKGYKTIVTSVTGEKFAKDKTNIKKLKILALMPLGFLFCKSSNRAKIETIFNMFANDENELTVDNKDFKVFICLMFSIPSGIFFITLKELSKEKDLLVGKLDDDKYQEIYSTYEIKDSLRNAEGFIKLLFNDKNVLNFDDFQNSITDSKLNWIFTSSGIRNYLENNNN